MKRYFTRPGDRKGYTLCRSGRSLGKVWREESHWKASPPEGAAFPTTFNTPKEAEVRLVMVWTARDSYWKQQRALFAVTDYWRRFASDPTSL